MNGRTASPTFLNSLLSVFLFSVSLCLCGSFLLSQGRPRRQGADETLDRVAGGRARQRPAEVPAGLVLAAVEPQLVAVQEQQHRVERVAVEGLLQPEQVGGGL